MTHRIFSVCMIAMALLTFGSYFAAEYVYHNSATVSREIEVLVYFVMNLPFILTFLLMGAREIALADDEYMRNVFNKRVAYASMFALLGFSIKIALGFSLGGFTPVDFMMPIGFFYGAYFVTRFMAHFKP